MTAVDRAGPRANPKAEHQARADALRDAEALNLRAKSDLPAALEELRRNLNAHGDVTYRGTLSLHLEPALLSEAQKLDGPELLGAELKELRGERDRERQGLLNAASGFLFDRFSKRGPHVDSTVAVAAAFDREARADGTLTSDEFETERGLITKAELEEQGYRKLRATVGDTAAMMVSVSAALGVAGLTEGLAAPLVVAAAAGGGALGQVATKSFIEGGDYSVEDAVRDAAVGAISGTAAKFSANYTGSVARGLAHKYGIQKTLVAAGAIDGAIVGSAQGLGFESLKKENWADGTPRGLLRVARGTAISAGTSVASGLGLGIFRGVRLRSRGELSAKLDHLADGPLGELPPHLQIQLRNLVLGESNPLSLEARVRFHRLVNGSKFKTQTSAGQASALKGFLDDPRVRPLLARAAMADPVARKFELSPGRATRSAFGLRASPAREQQLTLAGHEPIRILREEKGPVHLWTPSAAAVSKALSVLPDEALAGLREVHIHGYPGDGQKGWHGLNGTPSTRSGKLGNDPGVYNIYSDALKQNQVALRSALLHQYGHQVAHEKFGPSGTTDAWKGWDGAMEHDAMGPSRQAAVDPHEDLAESVSLYLSSRGSPAFEEYRRIMPGRFELLEKVLGTGAAKTG